MIVLLSFPRPSQFPRDYDNPHSHGAVRSACLLQSSVATTVIEHDRASPYLSPSVIRAAKAVHPLRLPTVGARRIQAFTPIERAIPHEVRRRLALVQEVPAALHAPTISYTTPLKNTRCVLPASAGLGSTVFFSHYVARYTALGFSSVLRPSVVRFTELGFLYVLRLSMVFYTVSTSFALRLTSPMLSHARGVCRCCSKASNSHRSLVSFSHNHTRPARRSW